MPKQPEPGHHPAMPYDAVPAFMARLRNSTSITACEQAWNSDPVFGVIGVEN
jgi:hypothetical protein